MTNQTYNNGEFPSEILIPIYYEYKTKFPYYVMETDDLNIERVDLNTIHEWAEEGECKGVSYWEPSRFGYDCKWRMTAEKFLSVAKLD